MGIEPECISKQTATEWSLTLNDAFDDNRNLWSYEPFLDKFENGSKLITDGKYRWRKTASHDVLLWAKPVMASVADFAAEVEIHCIRGPADASYGLLFRGDNDGQAYAYMASDSGYFSFFLRETDGWKPIIDWTWTPGIHPGTANELTVVAEGSDFAFYINDGFVGEAQDSRLIEGWVGLALGLHTGDEVSFEFDNFELREP